MIDEPLLVWRCYHPTDRSIAAGHTLTFNNPASAFHEDVWGTDILSALGEAAEGEVLYALSLQGEMQDFGSNQWAATQTCTTAVDAEAILWKYMAAELSQLPLWGLSPTEQSLCKLICQYITARSNKLNADPGSLEDFIYSILDDPRSGPNQVIMECFASAVIPSAYEAIYNFAYDLADWRISRENGDYEAALEQVRTSLSRQLQASSLGCVSDPAN